MALRSNLWEIISDATDRSGFTNLPVACNDIINLLESDAVIERVARGLCENADLDPYEEINGVPSWEKWIPVARAAIDALLDADSDD